MARTGAIGSMAKARQPRLPLALRRELDRAHRRMGKAVIFAEQQRARERQERTEQKRRRAWEGEGVVDEMQKVLDAKKKEDEIIYVDPADRSDQEERRARPYLGKFRSPVYNYLAPAPVVGPNKSDLKIGDVEGNRSKAGLYCDAIDDVMLRTADTELLSRVDRGNLRMLRKKWRLRADGASPYYDVWGTLPGKNEVCRTLPTMSKGQSATHGDMQEIAEMLEKELTLT